MHGQASESAVTGAPLPVWAIWTRLCLVCYRFSQPLSTSSALLPQVSIIVHFDTAMDLFPVFEGG